MIRSGCLTMIVTAALASVDASATGAVGEVFTKAYEERAEAEHRKIWCRWRWVRESMMARTSHAHGGAARTLSTTARRRDETVENREEGTTESR